LLVVFTVIYKHILYWKYVEVERFEQTKVCFTDVVISDLLQLEMLSSTKHMPSIFLPDMCLK